MRHSPVAEALEDREVTVECTHCGVQMTSHWGSGQRVRYFRCGGCYRWVSSTYADIFRADAKMRTRVLREDETGGGEFAAVKDRLERWLAAIEDADPYRALGASPMDSDDELRSKYRQLALARHPDRGGSEQQMRELNAAFERIKRHRAAAAARASVGALPAPSR